MRKETTTRSRVMMAVSVLGLFSQVLLQLGNNQKGGFVALYDPNTSAKPNKLSYFIGECNSQFRIASAGTHSSARFPQNGTHRSYKSQRNLDQNLMLPDVPSTRQVPSLSFSSFSFAHPVPSPILQSLQNISATEKNSKHCTNLTHPGPSPLFGACETFQQLNKKTHKCGDPFAIRLTHFPKTKQWPLTRHHCMIKQHNIGNNNTMFVSFVRESSSIIKWASSIQE
jgi:hypothetical protein